MRKWNAHFKGRNFKGHNFEMSGAHKFPSCCNYTGVSKNRGTPNSSILIGVSIIHLFILGFFPHFWFNTHTSCYLREIIAIPIQSILRFFCGWTIRCCWVTVTSVHQTVGGSLHSEDLRVKNRWHTSPKRWVLNKRWAIKINTFEGLLPLQYF